MLVVGSLSSELAPHAGRLAGHPRIYADANVPLGVVTYMRIRLSWDVFFVLEHDDLRRARDDEHYRLARQMGRTLVTLDRDYFDDRRFPPAESGGVIVCSAADERGLTRLVRRIHREIFQTSSDEPPLLGRKVHWHPGAVLE